MRIYAEDRHPPPLRPALSEWRAAHHFNQQAVERAAVMLKIGARYSRDEFISALATARQAFLYSLEEACVDIDAGRAVFEAFDVAVEFSRNRT